MVRQEPWGRGNAEIEKKIRGQRWWGFFLASGEAAAVRAIRKHFISPHRSMTPLLSLTLATGSLCLQLNRTIAPRAGSVAPHLKFYLIISEVSAAQ